MDRSQDWMDTAERELEMARGTVELEYYELVCFLCQQAAEKALKALSQSLRIDSWGHSLVALMDGVGAHAEVPAATHRAAVVLDRHYIPSRYPNGVPSGTPQEYFGRQDAEEAIAHAEEITAFCKRNLP